MLKSHCVQDDKNFTEELIPILNERAGFPPDTELALYEEIKPNLVEKIDNLTEPLEKVLEELMDGDIIVFQKEGDNDMYELPTCREYFKWVAQKALEDAKTDWYFLSQFV